MNIEKEIKDAHEVVARHDEQLQNLATRQENMERALEDIRKIREGLEERIKKGANDADVAKRTLYRFMHRDNETSQKDFAAFGESPEQFIHRKLSMDGKVMLGVGENAALCDRRHAPLAAMVRMARYEGGAHFAAAEAVMDKHGDTEGMGEFINWYRQIASVNTPREVRKRALGASDLSTGGVMVPLPFYEQITALLTDYATVRSSGCLVVPLEAGQKILPDWRSGATVGFVGEFEATNESSPTTGAQTLTAHILQVLAVVSQELQKYGSWATDIVLAETLLSSFAEREDQALLLGDGTENSIMGIEGHLNKNFSSHVFARTLSSGAPSVITVKNDLNNAIGLVESAKIRPSKGTFFMHPQVLRKISSIRDAAGYLFPEAQMGMLLGAPVKTTTQIPINLAGDASGVGTGNKSKILFVDASRVMLAEDGPMELAYAKNVSYKDADGNLQSGFSTRVDGVRLSRGIDLALRNRGQEAAEVTSVDWASSTAF